LAVLTERVLKRGGTGSKVARPNAFPNAGGGKNAGHVIGEGKRGGSGARAAHTTRQAARHARWLGGGHVGVWMVIQFLVACGAKTPQKTPGAAEWRPSQKLAAAARR
jgi:hypothetical protein